TDELTNKLGRSPSVKEIADYIDSTEEEVLEAMEMGQSYNALRVDYTIDADNEGASVTLLDVMGNEDENYELSEERMLIEKLLPILSEREQQIIRYTFLEGLSQKETGEKVGLSQMHVSRLQRAALKKLKESVKHSDNETYSGLSRVSYLGGNYERTISQRVIKKVKDKK